MTGCTMKIENLNGYLCHLELNKLDQTTLISGEHWDDLILHYNIDNDNQIVVNLDGAMVTKNSSRLLYLTKTVKKKVINEPGYNIWSI